MLVARLGKRNCQSACRWLGYGRVTESHNTGLIMEDYSVSMLVVRLGKRNCQSACWWLGKGRGTVSQHAGG